MPKPVDAFCGFWNDGSGKPLAPANAPTLTDHTRPPAGAVRASRRGQGGPRRITDNWHLQGDLTFLRQAGLLPKAEG